MISSLGLESLRNILNYVKWIIMPDPYLILALIAGGAIAGAIRIRAYLRKEKKDENLPYWDHPHSGDDKKN